MPRKSADVIAELLEAMRQTVFDYGTLKRTNDTLDAIIQGTAFFPGGSGLWRGDQPFGPLPEFFPEKPVMFVAHNFDKESSYRKSLARGIEDMRGFWEYLRAYIKEAELSENQCFFTNASMGLQPVKAEGQMDASDAFRDECRRFMQKQVDIVDPRCIAILGDDAASELNHASIAVPFDKLKHPSWLAQYVKVELRPTIIREQGARLRSLYAKSKTN